MLGPTCRYLQWSVFFFRGCNCNGCNCNGFNVSWRCLVALSQWCNVVLSENRTCPNPVVHHFPKMPSIWGCSSFCRRTGAHSFSCIKIGFMGEASKQPCKRPLIPSDAWLNRGLPGPRQEQCGPLPQLSSGLTDPETGAQDQ